MLLEYKTYGLTGYCFAQYLVQGKVIDRIGGKGKVPFWYV